MRARSLAFGLGRSGIVPRREALSVTFRRRNSVPSDLQSTTRFTAYSTERILMPNDQQ